MSLLVRFLGLLGALAGVGHGATGPSFKPQTRRTFVPRPMAFRRNWPTGTRNAVRSRYNPVYEDRARGFRQ